MKYTITITDTGGFTGPVAFSVSGLPSGLTASFSSSSQTSATLTISASSRIRKHGNYTFTVTGTSAGTRGARGQREPVRPLTAGSL